MNKPDLELDNLQWLICHKIKPNLYKSYGFNYFYLA